MDENADPVPLGGTRNGQITGNMEMIFRYLDELEEKGLFDDATIIITTVIIILAEFCLAKLEYRLMDSAPEINLYMEYSGRPCLENVLKFCREKGMKLLDMEITRSASGDKSASCVILTLRLNKRSDKQEISQLLAQLYDIKGVEVAEEL